MINFKFYRRVRCLFGARSWILKNPPPTFNSRVIIKGEIGNKLKLS